MQTRLLYRLKTNSLARSFAQRNRLARRANVRQDATIFPAATEAPLWRRPTTSYFSAPEIPRARFWPKPFSTIGARQISAHSVQQAIRLVIFTPTHCAN